MIEWATWWVLVLVIGLAAAPLSALLLPRFTTAGYAFSKPLGVMLLGFVYWLGLTARVLPNSRTGVAVALLTLAAVALGVAWRRRWRDVRALREGARFALGVEALFLAAFAVAALLRAYVPEIRDTEKPMELGFLNAVLRADHFPPADPWLAGEPISYYYFGFVQLAAVAKLAGTTAAIAFNLGLALTAALSVIAVFGLGYELVARATRDAAGSARTTSSRRAWAFGGVAIVFALLLGNLEGALEMGAAHGWGPDAFYRSWDIEGLPLPGSTGHWYPDEFFWWWRATRVIPGTITEFPFFSFMLGDLHPHAMAIPARFVFLAFVASLLLGDGARVDRAAWLARERVALLVLVAVVLGSFGFLFTWDMPAMAALLGLAAYIRIARQSRAPAASLVDAAVYAGVPLAVGIAAFLPFWLSIDNPGWGIKVVLGEPTRPSHALLVWAPLGLIVALFVAAAMSAGDRAVLRDRRALLAAAGIPLAIAAVWAIWVVAAHDGGALRDEVTGRGWGWLTDAVLGVFVATTALALLQRASSPTGDDPGERGATFALLTALVALLLLLGAEFFYVDDVLQRRLNTVFKLSFQAWLLLAISAAFGAHYLTRTGLPLGRTGARAPARVGAALATGAVALVLAGALVYPITATLARTDALEGTPALDGLAWLRESSPAEYDAQMWLRQHSDPGDIVLEAYGEAYTPAGRVSSRTGTPTLLGWWIHEINWRGYRDTFGERAGDMNLIYESDDMAQVQALLDGYGVDWVYAGDLERSRYPNADLTKFARIMDVAYETGGVVIYRARDGAPRP